MQYNLINKDTKEECKFSKKQITFLQKYFGESQVGGGSIELNFEVVNMAEEGKSKEQIEKEIKALEDKKAAMDKEIKEKKEAAISELDGKFANKIEGLDKEIEEKKKSLEDKPDEGEGSSSEGGESTEGAKSEEGEAAPSGEGGAPAS